MCTVCAVGGSPVPVPLQITFRGMTHSDTLDSHLRRRADKLARFFDRIVACHVVVEVPHRHHRHGKRYRVTVDVKLPRGEIAVSRAPDDDRKLEDLHASIEETFDEAERQLEEWARRRRPRIAPNEETRGRA